MIIRHYRSAPLALTEHQYLVIDRMRAGTLPDTLQLTELVTPLTAPQAHLYPWLLSLNTLPTQGWAWLEAQYRESMQIGSPAPSFLLLSSHQPESVVRSHLIHALFISDAQQKRHLLRWFDSRVLFHLGWMAEPRQLASMLNIHDIPDWTYWLNGQWHTLSFDKNDEPDPLSTEPHHLFQQLQHVGLINDVLATLPSASDLSQREQLSRQICYLLQVALEKYQLSDRMDLTAFARHGLKYGEQVYQADAVRLLIHKGQISPGIYYRESYGWTSEQWDATSHNLSKENCKG